MLINIFSENGKNRYHKKRLLFTTSSVPGFTMKDRDPTGDFNSFNHASVIMSIPSYLRLKSKTGSIEEVRF